MEIHTVVSLDAGKDIVWRDVVPHNVVEAASAGRAFALTVLADFFDKFLVVRRRKERTTSDRFAKKIVCVVFHKTHPLQKRITEIEVSRVKLNFIGVKGSVFTVPPRQQLDAFSKRVAVAIDSLAVVRSVRPSLFQRCTEKLLAEFLSMDPPPTP